LVRAIRLVAEDMRLAPDWLNTGPALQWRTGLPPGLAGRIQWRRYGSALDVGIAGRYDLIFFKLSPRPTTSGRQAFTIRISSRSNPRPKS
jgi:hypothetical protein